MFVLLFRWWDVEMLNWDRMNEQVVLSVFFILLIGSRLRCGGIKMQLGKEG
jgi:hypothetical protein